MEGIEAMGFKTPTPIQEQAIPAILEGKDIIGSAQTGTGKTAAFLLPVIQNIIAQERTNKTRALIIVPTRELAQQIDQQMEGFWLFHSGELHCSLWRRRRSPLCQGEKSADGRHRGGDLHTRKDDRPPEQQLCEV